jgi:hypothetical protein
MTTPFVTDFYDRLLGSIEQVTLRGRIDRQWLGGTGGPGGGTGGRPGGFIGQLNQPHVSYDTDEFAKITGSGSLLDNLNHIRYNIYTLSGILASGFLGLNDTPNTYSGEAYDLVVVGSGETGLEFMELIAGSGITITNSGTSITIAASGSGGGSGTPGGSNTQVQYNNSGSFAGSPNFTFDGNNTQLAGYANVRRLRLAENGTTDGTYNVFLTERPSSSVRRIMMYGAAQSNSFGFIVAPTDTASKSDVVVGLWAQDIDGTSPVSTNFAVVNLKGNSGSSDLQFTTTISDSDRGDIVFAPRASEVARFSLVGGTSNPQVLITGAGSGSTPIDIKAAASPAQPITRWLKSDGTTVQAKVDNNFNFSESIGATTSLMTEVGVANIQTDSSGIGNGADTTDDTLFTYTLPANAMSSNGKSIRCLSTGHFATNVNTKEVKFWFAGNTIIDSGALTLSNTDWMCEMEITRIDSTHVSCVGKFTGNNVASVVTVTANLSVSDLTANTSIIKVTGASTTIGTANDVKSYLMKTWFEN